MDVLKNRYKCQNVLSGIDGRGHFKTVLIFLRRTLYKAIEKYQNLTGLFSLVIVYSLTNHILQSKVVLMVNYDHLASLIYA